MNSTRAEIEQSGFSILPSMFLPHETEKLIRDLEEATLRRSKAGIRHALRHESIRNLAAKPSLLGLVRDILGREALDIGCCSRSSPCAEVLSYRLVGFAYSSLEVSRNFKSIRPTNPTHDCRVLHVFAGTWQSPALLCNRVSPHFRLVRSKVVLGRTRCFLPPKRMGYTLQHADAPSGTIILPALRLPGEILKWL